MGWRKEMIRINNGRIKTLEQQAKTKEALGKGFDAYMLRQKAESIRNNNSELERQIAEEG